MATYKENFTKDFIKKITPPQKGRDYYYDTQEKGLILDVTSAGNKAYYLYKKKNGTPIRIKLGDADILDVKDARRLANKNKDLLNEGKNPNEEKHKFRKESTLKELFQEFMERYSKKEKKSWKYDEREIPKFLSLWFNRKISDISKQQVQKLHEKIRDENGLYQANRILERLKSMYNRAIDWGWDGTNPCNGIKKFKEIKRDRFLLPSELPAFLQALEEEENISAKNYIWISLLTGARKFNVLAMRWEEIDFDRRIWRIPETKNGEPLNVPLVEQAIQLLETIKQDNESEWVFPSQAKNKKDPKTSHLKDPKKAWGRILARAGIDNLRIHDIRRTLGSWQIMTGATLPVVGKSLGHKSPLSTATYARMDNSPTRKHMQIAVRSMLECKNTKE